jgi:hypothetical protein
MFITITSVLNFLKNTYFVMKVILILIETNKYSFHPKLLVILAFFGAQYLLSRHTNITKCIANIMHLEKSK